MLELYHSPGSCSLAPHIVLQEVGADYRLIAVPVREGANIRPEYLAINPKGRVPALRLGEGGRILTEAPAILVYLAKQAPGLELLGPGDVESEARCLEWLAWLSTAAHAVGFGAVWRPLRFVANESCLASVTETGLKNIRDTFGMIEEAVSGGRPAAVRGSGFTVVDAYLLVFYRWGTVIGLDMARAYPAWTRLTAGTAARPSVQRALQIEGVDLGL